MSASADTIVFGSTDAGFVPRRLADIQKSMNEKLALIVDPRTGEKPFQNATDDTIAQQVAAIIAEELAFTENAAANGFAMRDPLTATGAGQSQLAQLNAIMRKPGGRTVIPEYLFGAPSTFIPAGSQISHDGSDQIYALNENVVVPQNGVAETVAVCTKDGPYDPEPGTVMTILTPVSGWESATNGKASSIGSYEETDEELRARQQLSTNATSYRQVEAIRAAVANVEGVSFVRTYQNITCVTDDRGIPGKSLACVVVGGADRAIAETILFRVPLGIGYYGSTSVTIYDELGMGTAIEFSRPKERLICVRVHLEIVVDERKQKFPSNGDALVKKAIVDFANRGHSACEPLGNDAFVPGNDIVRSYLYTPINSIGGARVKYIELGEKFTDDPEEVIEYAEQDIVIAWNEIGLFSEDRIEVDFP